MDEKDSNIPKLPIVTTPADQEATVGDIPNDADVEASKVSAQ